MNDAHLHLLVNHFPIIGTIIGFGILMMSLFLKNKSIQNVAYVIFILGSIFTLASMSTGEGAEELVENMPNIGHDIIHEHEEIAEKLAIVLYALGFASIIGLYANQKNHPKSRMMSFLVATIALVGVVISIEVGTTGGEIRHTEIRENYNPNSKENEKNDQINSD